MAKPNADEDDRKEEIEALQTILRTLEPLTKDQKARLLRCAKELFGIYMGPD